MTRLVLAGRMAARWLTTIPVDPSAPTQSELTAGVNLIGSSQGEGLYEMEGFVRQSNVIDTPDYVSLNVGNVGGDQTYPSSRMAFYWDSAVHTISTALEEDEVGWIALAFDGLGAALPALIFPSTVLSQVRRPDRNFAHVFDVNFAISSPYVAVQAA